MMPLAEDTEKVAGLKEGKPSNPDNTDCRDQSQGLQLCPRLHVPVHHIFCLTHHSSDVLPYISCPKSFLCDGLVKGNHF